MKIKLTITESKCRCDYCKKGDVFIVDDLNIEKPYQEDGRCRPQTYKEFAFSVQFHSELFTVILSQASCRDQRQNHTQENREYEAEKIEPEGS